MFKLVPSSLSVVLRALGNKLKAVQRYLDHLCDCRAGEMEV